MYDGNSDIIAAKIWTLQDIIDNDKDITKEDAKEIENLLDKDVLSDCTDSEWKEIEDAINEWKGNK